MNVAGIDGHASYAVVTVLSSRAKMLHGPVRIKNSENHRLVELLEAHRPREPSFTSDRSRSRFGTGSTRRPRFFEHCTAYPHADEGPPSAGDALLTWLAL
jgi:hypothetical protein